MNVKPTDHITPRIPDGYYTRSMAARIIGRSESTLKRWEDTGSIVLKNETWIGGVRVKLYSEADIDKLRVIKSTKKVGRPKKEVEAQWTPKQH